MNENNVIVTDIFKNMLHQILVYYSLYSNVYTLKIMYEVKQAVRLISEYPDLAPRLAKDKSMRKFIIKKRFSIIYKVENDTVELLYFIDSRMLNDTYVMEEEIELYHI